MSSNENDKRYAPVSINTTNLKNTIMIPEERLQAWGYSGRGRGILRYDFQMSSAQKDFFNKSQTVLNDRVAQEKTPGRLAIFHPDIVLITN